MKKQDATKKQGDFRKGAGGMMGGGGMGGMMGMGGGGVEIDPLMGLNDARKPLRSKVLTVPSLRKVYLQHVREIAEKQLDWKTLGPIVSQYRKLIDKEIKADTKKLSSYEAFERATANQAAAETKASAKKAEAAPGGRGPREISLRAFADQRRKYLLNNSDVKKAAP